MVDAEKLLKDLGVYDDYRPAALNYQRFDDGSLYMIPFQFELEFFWYNKALLQKAGVAVPTSIDDIPAMCTALRKAGITPIALDGRTSGRWSGTWPTSPSARRTDYVQKLKKADAKFSDPTGRPQSTG